jgi:uncharacterized membrane protein YphA (DoxX/SURF4 family)
MKINDRLKATMRIFAGAVFLVSAILKLISIDSFEIYLYGFGIIKLEYAFALARLIISLELLTGIVLITGIYVRMAVSIAIAMLLVFSAFILILIFTRNDENCHCFGEIEMSHTLSLLKNILLAALLAISCQSQSSKFRYNRLILMVTAAISLLLPLIVSPPDSFFYARNSKNITYDEFMLDEFLKENDQFTKGRKMLCFFSTGCRFCKLAARKISVIAKKADDDEVVNYVFAGAEVSVDKFFKETNSTVFQYSFLPPNRFLKITNGVMPLIILLQDGKVKGKYGYRDIREDELIRFLKE